MQKVSGITALCAFISFWWVYRGYLRKLPYVLTYWWACLAALVYFNIWGLLDLRWALGVGMALLGAWFAIQSRGWRMNELSMYWLGIVALMVLSMTWSLLPTYTLLCAGGVGTVIIFGVIGISALCNCESGRRAIFLAMICSITGLGPLLLFGFEEYQAGEANSRYTALAELRATGTAGLALNCAIAMVYYTCAGPSNMRWAARAALIACIVLAYMSGTRGTLLISLLVLPALWAALRARGRRVDVLIAVYLLIGILGTVSWALLPDDTKDSVLVHLRLDDLEMITKTRTKGRWDVVLPKALERPVLGRGFSTSRYFPENDAMVQSCPELRDTFRWSYVHNQYLSVFYDLGIVGLTLFLVPIGMTGWRIIDVYSMSRLGAAERAMFMTMSAMWLNLIMGMMFHDGYLTIGNANAYWFCISGVWIWHAHRACTWNRHKPAGRFPRRKPALKRRCQKVATF